MAPIFDDFPYPWHRRDAQQLHLAVTQLLHDTSSALQFASEVGIPSYMLTMPQTVFSLWREIFDKATGKGVLKQLIKNIHDTFPTSPMRATLAAALAGVPIADPTPTTASGKVNFIHGSSEITNNEALLYHHDLTLETGKIPALINALQAMLQYTPSVCKLTLRIHDHPQFGTAFRIGENMLLTNWHVLHKLPEETVATKVDAEFGFEYSSNDDPLSATIIPCDETSIVSDKDNDWAIIRTKIPMNAAWPVIKLSEAVAPKLNTSAYIIQHPNGDRKRIGFVRNQVSFFDADVVHYLTDTQEGSSGAPVFNSGGQLIALHHRGGDPQEVLGRPPTKKNEGIRISRITEGLTANNIVFP